MTEFLARTGGVVLDASGSGTVRFAPDKYQETWRITKFTTDGNSAVVPQLDVCRGLTDIIDTTLHGNSDVSETDVTIHSGEFLTIRYSGGTAGAAMRFYLEGTISRGV